MDRRAFGCTGMPLSVLGFSCGAVGTFLFGAQLPHRSHAQNRPSLTTFIQSRREIPPGGSSPCFTVQPKLFADHTREWAQSACLCGLTQSCKA